MDVSGHSMLPLAALMALLIPFGVTRALGALLLVIFLCLLLYRYLARGRWGEREAQAGRRARHLAGRGAHRAR